MVLTARRNWPRESSVCNRLHHLLLRRRGPIDARSPQRHGWNARYARYARNARYAWYAWNARYARYARNARNAHARNARNARPSRLPPTSLRLPTYVPPLPPSLSHNNITSLTQPHPFSASRPRFPTPSFQLPSSPRPTGRAPASAASRNAPVPSDGQTRLPAAARRRSDYGRDDTAADDGRDAAADAWNDSAAGKWRVCAYGWCAAGVWAAGEVGSLCSFCFCFFPSLFFLFLWFLSWWVGL